MTARQNPHLGGLVLGSTDPQRLYEWYRQAFAPEAEKAPSGMPGLELGGTYLVFEERDDVAATAAEPGRVLFTIVVDDIRAAEARISALGAHWVRPVTEPAPGEPILLATAEDPDGNYPQILQVLDGEVSP